MAQRLTHAELQDRVLDIDGAVVKGLHAVPCPQRAGDWDGLANHHRRMLEIIEWGREVEGRLVPPEESEAAWRAYLAAYDEQIVHERRVLAAVEARSMAEFSAAVRTLAGPLQVRKAAAEVVGLKRLATRRQRAKVWATLPYVLARANWHMRREARAGRTWD